MRWRDRYEKEGLEGVKWNGISGRPLTDNCIIYLPKGVPK
ncbi:hypothetical protein [Leptospira santarosai]|nr:hypothetical protein [Leptospira santarosai]